MNAQQAHDDRLIRLEVRPAGPGIFDGYWEGERIIARSTTPLLDAGRALKAQSINTSRPMTMRHAGAAHDSFYPKPVEHWAALLISENDKRRLRVPLLERSNAGNRLGRYRDCTAPRASDRQQAH